MFDDARISMFPPAAMDAPVPMYASTVGEAVALDSEPPIATPPPATPCDVASASGRAAAEMCRFALRCSCELPATYAWSVGLACAVALLSESAPRPPDTACDDATAVFAEDAEMLTLLAPGAPATPRTSPAT